jgi:hypothetical protein
MAPANARDALVLFDRARDIVTALFASLQGGSDALTPEQGRYI